jgi:adenine deaminase
VPADAPVSGSYFILEFSADDRAARRGRRSDAPQIFNVPGFSIEHELRMLVDAGLTPYQALETGTRNVAVFFGAQNEFGTVEVGRAADLILLEANPLQDIRNVQRRAGVMVCGRWLPESEIQQRLETVAAGMRS